MDDWQQEAGVLKIDGRKTGQERNVAVGAGVWRCVEAYLPHRHNLLEKIGRVEQENALFLNRFGARLNGQNISRIVHSLAKQAGVGLVSVHAFRHSCASDLLERGVALPDVQKVLGHAALASTMRYTHVTDPERAKAIKAHPINDFLSSENVERMHYENA
jgi:site-specific recombinase XerD